MKFEERMEFSTFMSLILRHKPHKFGVNLDHEGYCPIEDLLKGINRTWRNRMMTKEQILEVVRKSPKQRFELNDVYIRARYGHSNQNIKYKEAIPPDILIHGTYEGAVESILNTGIKKMQHDHVHSTDTFHFAKLAGERRGKVVYFLIDTKKAREQKVRFYHPGKEVWLSDDIPPNCITLQK